MNANWAAGAGGAEGEFELLVVTEDDLRHILAPTVHEASALLALVRASPVLLWDPDNSTLIGSNLVGDWLPLDWSSSPPA